MSKININDLKKIREMTGVSVDAIKMALEEADGKIEQALELLKKRGVAVAAKKALRQTGEGVIASYIHATGKIGVLVKVLCETDFVVRNEQFKQLGHELAMHIAAANPQSIKELLSQPYIRNQDITVEDVVNDYIGKLGENIQIGEFCRFEI
ncbi:elongation factor Ts [Candidatus Azambacteria bacterium RIFCSPHIGHO2_01_FULL_44_55]|uniref:Elongation factor Ts n=1 Tax=Candidatus Azambacteria bacterium RIFCSPLOWO2_02_FULL_44_14 TaxID=1797306 RepID=A0A1F5C9W1_9BACT|nr:MAG: elongation factor Ts [Candidatus Azambacteria bacterium RIFCSPLOWO2_01_FULL_44_84]OGD33124.1 MAG: elongation factor Ts [Candidatus Azambacteria bacterium RIFCSPHIGHO2_02_FULL_45_18]OGD39632.1 MAG: elongation factor Ts [Candidatus Azambacteria bacterium RIFCSPLOWO2_02_FULL_44_14]OGD40865.1 MAG: elongation factor Ts [Candidatus Azambacteria bacterium RIFCSPHIGHO2_01_FULL_44_55]OGD51956.1 MAG: elongation factor Ts [Candidatus Azambacteria bacterium RIFOXYD1_FULL_44_10]